MENETQPEPEPEKLEIKEVAYTTPKNYTLLHLKDGDGDVYNEIKKVYKLQNISFHNNDLINTIIRLTLLEFKIFCIIINQLNSTDDENINTKPAPKPAPKGTRIKIDLWQNMWVEFPVSTFGEDYSHKHLNKALKKLLNKSIEVGSIKKQDYGAFTIFPEYTVKNGVVSIKINRKALKYLAVAGDYTKYHLKTLMSFKSRTAAILFTVFLMKTRWHNEFKISIDQLKAHLGIDNTDKSFIGIAGTGNFIRRVIKPTMAELLNNAGLYFIFEPIKKDKTIVSIKFIRKQNEEKDVLSLRGEELLAETEKILRGYRFSDGQKKIIMANDLGIQDKFLLEHVYLLDRIKLNKINDIKINDITKKHAYIYSILNEMYPDQFPIKIKIKIKNKLKIKIEQ